MPGEMFRKIGLSVMIAVAIYPLVFAVVLGLVYLGALAADLQMPSDMMPLIYGLVFAVLTVALVDIIGVATVALALISCANLIEYAQLLIPGRSASLIDFLASLSGIFVALVLIWMARKLVERHFPSEETAGV